MKPKDVNLIFWFVFEILDFADQNPEKALILDWKMNDDL